MLLPLRGLYVAASIAAAHLFCHKVKMSNACFSAKWHFHARVLWQFLDIFTFLHARCYFQSAAAEILDASRYYRKRCWFHKMPTLFLRKNNVQCRHVACRHAAGSRAIALILMLWDTSSRFNAHTVAILGRRTVDVYFRLFRYFHYILKKLSFSP